MNRTSRMLAVIASLAAPNPALAADLSLFGSSGLGSTVTVSLAGTPSQPSGLFFSVGFSDLPLHVGGPQGGDFFLDLNVPWFLIPLPPIPAGGVLEFPLAIPTDAVLQGIAVHFQAFAPGLSNPVSMLLHAPDQHTSIGIANERLGTAVMSGDFDDDGTIDVAAAATNASSGAGAVHLFRNTGSGLAPLATLTDPTPQANANFGNLVLTADLLGDGTDDIVVSAPYAGAVVKDDSGEVFVFDGGTLAMTQQLTHPTGGIGTGYGTGIALGDFDADGALDLAIGAPGAKVGVFALAGEVHVLRGPSFTPWKVLRATQLKPSAIFGGVLDAADQDLDGKTDLLVGAVSAIQGGFFGAGEAWLFKGPLTALPVLYTDPSPSTGGAFGCRTVLADVTGGPALDVVIGTPGGNGTPAGNPTAVNQVGEVEIYIDGVKTNPLILDDPTPEYFQHYGMDVQVTDVNGDGHQDVISSAFLADIAGQVDAGEVFVYLGPTLNQVHEFSAATTQAGQQFGVFLYGVDLDQDGKSELVVGAPYETVGGATFAGALHTIDW